MGGLDIGHLQVRKHAVENLLLLIGEIAPRLFTNHLEMIDKELCGLEEHLGLARVRIGNATEKERGLLGLHHHELDELLRHFARVSGVLNFSHGQDCGFNLGRGGLLRRSDDDLDPRRSVEVFRGHATSFRRPLDLRLAAEIIVETKAHQFIDRDAGGKGGIALVSDCLGTEKLFLRASKFFFGKPVLGQGYRSPVGIPAVTASTFFGSVPR